MAAAHGADADRLPVYLADTLAPRRAEVLDSMTDPVSAEGLLAEQVKFERPANVIIGNPPYDRDASSKGGFVLQKGPNGRSLFDDILDDAKQHVIFSHTKSLNDLYVYFWRWSLWKALEQNEGPAVVSLITSSSWLAGPGFLGLRRLARELADEIYIVDLGGAGRGARKEENVFDIQTPVAIVTLLRRGSTERRVPARSAYVRVAGTRQEKLSRLSELTEYPESAEWCTLDDAWHAPLVPAAGNDAWLSLPLVTDLFPWQQPGCSWGRTFPVAPDPDVLDQRWREFVSTDDVAVREKLYAAAKSGRNLHTRVASQPSLAQEPMGAVGSPIVRYGYRSFDRQWSFSDIRFASLERPSLWWSLSSVQVFMTSMLTNPLGSGPAATVTAFVPDFHHFCGRGGKDVIPLYRDAMGTPNVDPATLKRLSEILGRDVTPEQLFAYAFGVLAGSDYTDRFGEALATPGPRLPLTADPALFERVAEHGRRLIWLQTFGDRFGEEGLPDIGLKWSPAPSRLPASKSDIAFDPASRELHVADGVLRGVSDDVWRFSVSGMEVLPKWLGYRMVKAAGRAASSASPLDAIRPTKWLPEWNVELVEVVTAISESLAMLPEGADLLDEVLAGPLMMEDALPRPAEWLRQPPKSRPIEGDVIF